MIGAFLLGAVIVGIPLWFAKRQDEQTRRDRVFARQHRVRRPLW